MSEVRYLEGRNLEISKIILKSTTENFRSFRLAFTRYQRPAESIEGCPRQG